MHDCLWGKLCVFTYYWNWNVLSVSNVLFCLKCIEVKHVGLKRY